MERRWSFNLNLVVVVGGIVNPAPCIVWNHGNGFVLQNQSGLKVFFARSVAAQDYCLRTAQSMRFVSTSLRDSYAVSYIVSLKSHVLSIRRQFRLP